MCLGECSIGHDHGPRFANGQRGMVLIFALIALLILGIGAAAMIRSFDTSSVTSTNLGFKRDLANEGAVAFAQAQAWFLNTTKLGSSTVQTNDTPAYSYYASTQDTNSYGVPKALLDKVPAAPVGEIDSTNNSSLLPGITIYFLIDRLCSNTGAASTVNCVVSQLIADKSGTSGIPPPGGASPIVYRVSVRVDGPHDTHVFLQQTITAPS